MKQFEAAPQEDIPVFDPSLPTSRESVEQQGTPVFDPNLPTTVESRERKLKTPQVKESPIEASFKRNLAETKARFESGEAQKEAAKMAVEGQSDLQNFAAGGGGALVGQYQALQQMTGFGDQEEIDATKTRRDALDETKAGLAGNITGQVLPAIVAGGGAAQVASKIPAAASAITKAPALAKYAPIIAGAATQGSLIPTTTQEGDSRLGNVAFSAAVAPAMTLGFDKVVAPIGGKVYKKIAKKYGERAARKAQETITKDLAQEEKILNQITINLNKKGIDFDSLGKDAQDELLGYVKKATASGVDDLDEAAIARAMKLQDMDVPIKATRGQLSGDYIQQTDERLLADTAAGAGIRDVLEEQPRKLVENIEKIREKTGGVSASPADYGRSIRGSVQKRADESMKGVRAAYELAEETAGESPAKLPQKTLDWLEENAGFEGVDGLITKAKKLGILDTDDAGNLIAQDAPLKNLYRLRSTASKLQTGGGNKGYDAGEFKKLIDNTFSDQGGAAYRTAARLRAKHGGEFERGSKVVADTIKKKKAFEGSQIADEDVFNKTVVNSSIQDIKDMYKFQLGNKATRKQGVEQIKNMRAQTAQHLEDAMRKNGGDTFSYQGFKSAIKKMGGKPKLEAIYGKKGADKIMNVLEAAQLLTQQKGGMAKGSQTGSRLARMAEKAFTFIRKTPYVGDVADEVTAVAKSKSVLSDPVKEATNKLAKATAKAETRNLLSSEIAETGRTVSSATGVAGANKLMENGAKKVDRRGRKK